MIHPGIIWEFGLRYIDISHHAQILDAAEEIAQQAGSLDCFKALSMGEFNQGAAVYASNGFPSAFKGVWEDNVSLPVAKEVLAHLLAKHKLDLNKFTSLADHLMERVEHFYDAKRCRLGAQQMHVKHAAAALFRDKLEYFAQSHPFGYSYYHSNNRFEAAIGNA